MMERHARMEERLAALLARRLRADPRRDPTPALLAFVARALMDTAFNVWFDQRPADVGAMVDDLFRRLREAVAAPGITDDAPSLAGGPGSGRAAARTPAGPSALSERPRQGSVVSVRPRPTPRGPAAGSRGRPRASRKRSFASASVACVYRPR